MSNIGRSRATCLLARVSWLNEFVVAGRVVIRQAGQGASRFARDPPHPGEPRLAAFHPVCKPFVRNWL
jgi:hypothetical protein